MVSASWGDLANTPPGSYQIARLTFPQGVLPEVHPLSQTSQNFPSTTVLIVPIPEPALLGALGLLAVAGVRRVRS